jgi:hypothetical protein
MNIGRKRRRLGRRGEEKRMGEEKGRYGKI